MGQVATIDAVDWPLVSNYKWQAARRRNAWYAIAYVRGSGSVNPKMVLMHRVIAGSLPREKTDHWDGDGLNNRRENLRRCTHAQNMRNMRKWTRKGFKGVSYFKWGGFCPEARPWRARLMKEGREMALGYFATAEEAARAYDAAAREHFGEFAFLNFPTN